MTDRNSGNPGVFELLDLVSGYQQAAAVTAAARLRVFDVLSAAPATAVEMAVLLDTDASATRALLDTLAGLGLVRSGCDGYSATPIGARLATGGDLRLIVEKEAFFARTWLSLADSVRSGRPRLSPWRQRLITDPAQAREFLAALVVLATETGPDLTQLPGVCPGARIADLGGGLGSYAAPLAAAGAEVTLVDLPPVAAWAAERLQQESVTVCAVDLLAADAPDRIGTGFDVVLLAHLLHDLDDTDARRVLRCACTICRPGGQVVVFELPGDPPGTFGPLFDLMMRVETPGRARRAAELTALLTGSGLTAVGELPGYPRPHGVFSGFR